MGYSYPINPSQDGDNETLAPTTLSRSLLGAERGNQNARRLEVDANRNLYVRIAADDTVSSVSALAGGSVSNVPATTLTTILTYTPTSTVKITRISVSGQNYGKIQLFINSSLTETKRMGPDRNVEFVFSTPLNGAASVPIDIKVTHYITGELNDFEATIYGV